MKTFELDTEDDDMNDLNDMKGWGKLEVKDQQHRQ